MMFRNQNKMPLMLITPSFVLPEESDTPQMTDMLLLRGVRSKSKKAFPLRMLAMHLRMPRDIESFPVARRTGPMKTRSDGLFSDLVNWILLSL